jgi:hypothetical protein
MIDGAIKWRIKDVIDSENQTQSPLPTLVCQQTPSKLRLLASVDRSNEFTGIVEAARVRRAKSRTVATNNNNNNSKHVESSIEDRLMLTTLHTLHSRIVDRQPSETIADSQLRTAYDSVYCRVLLLAQSEQVVEHCKVIHSLMTPEPRVRYDRESGATIVVKRAREQTMSRSKELVEIEAQIEALLPLFAQILDLVSKQGESIERIDSNVGRTESNSFQVRRIMSRLNTQLGGVCRIRRSVMLKLLMILVLFVSGTILVTF